VWIAVTVLIFNTNCSTATACVKNKYKASNIAVKITNVSKWRGADCCLSCHYWEHTFRLVLRGMSDDWGATSCTVKLFAAIIGPFVFSQHSSLVKVCLKHLQGYIIPWGGTHPYGRKSCIPHNISSMVILVPIILWQYAWNRGNQLWTVNHYATLQSYSSGNENTLSQPMQRSRC
jgi:hypothetical protein